MPTTKKREHLWVGIYESTYQYTYIHVALHNPTLHSLKKKQFCAIINKIEPLLADIAWQQAFEKKKEKVRDSEGFFSLLHSNDANRN